MKRRPSRPDPADRITWPATCTECGRPVARDNDHVLEEDFLGDQPPTVSHIACPASDESAEATR